MMFVRGLGGAGMFFRITDFMVPGLWISIAAVALAMEFIVYLAVSATKTSGRPSPTARADALKLRYSRAN
jgi:hypothetical protein